MSHKIDFVKPPAVVAADLGATLARIRLSRNITQQDLANRAGVSDRTIKRFEAGQGASLDTLIRLMQALDLDDHLATLLPDPAMQPLEHLKRQGKERQRARPRASAQPTPWSWDEDQTP